MWPIYSNITKFLYGVLQNSLNKATIQAFQNFNLRLNANASWLVSNKNLYSNLNIKTIDAEMHHLRFHSKLNTHSNPLRLSSKTFSNNLNRRLYWYRDLLLNYILESELWDICPHKIHFVLYSSQSINLFLYFRKQIVNLWFRMHIKNLSAKPNHLCELW